MRIALALLSVAVVVGLRVAADETEGITFVTVRQGINYYDVAGERVFVLREGSVVTAFLGRSTGGGEPLVYCIDEAAFVAPLETSMWTARGEWVAGPAPRDLDQVRATVGNDGVLRLDAGAVKRSDGRGAGEVSGEVGRRYEAYRNGDTTAGFCVDHFPAPQAVPSGSPS